MVDTEGQIFTGKKFFKNEFLFFLALILLGFVKKRKKEKEIGTDMSAFVPI